MTFPSDNSLSSPVLLLRWKRGGWGDTLSPLPPTKLNETWISQTKETELEEGKRKKPGNYNATQYPT